MRPVVIDCNNLCHIAMHSMGDLSYRDMQTGVVFGFFLKLQKIANDFKSTNFVMCWDSRRSIRQKVYPDYKRKRIEQRAEMTEEEKQKYMAMVRQVRELRTEILPRLGFRNNFLRPGYESDDLMAWLVMNNEKNWLMVSADNDMYQCLDHCDIFNPQTKKAITRLSFGKKYQISPRQWPMAKAIGGCDTDNVQGVQGVGDPKKETSMALKFLRGELKESGVVYKRIVDSTEVINRNLELVHLPYWDFKPLRKLRANKFDAGEFRVFFDDKHFRSFLRDMKKWEIFFKE